ncbi:uncharacterized protein zgc:109986 isoform X2 [Lampris incognitus]|uniref:uncharacterized protein zgc:109986 isoform X2 n=1 Tax=Lampris incognitus TaxID=2546036 RepID=UPI0024B5F860|nr:uncharacterized protein zgc:109986 isoform X2 [Lampris incognitus]
MNFADAKAQVQRLLSTVSPEDLPKLIDWMKNTDELEDYLVDNQRVILQSISEDLRTRLPVDAMFSSETAAIHNTQQQQQQQQRPTVHVDSFLYDEEQVDVLCEEGKLSRCFCLSCGSRSTAALDFISHSFSIPELQFLFQRVLPDLTGRLLLDVGSRLGAVLYAGYLYSSAAQLVGVEITEDFVRLQKMAVEKYGFSDRIQVLHADVCSQGALVQTADVLVMNNVFQFFMEPSDQIKAWQFIVHHFRKRGSLLVTVPSLQESLSALQVVDTGQWVEEVPLDYDIYLGKNCDSGSLREIHLYRVL